MNLYFDDNCKFQWKNKSNCDERIVKLSEKYMNEIAAYKNTRRRKQYRNQRINFELIKNLNSDFINFKQKKHIYRNNITK